MSGTAVVRILVLPNGRVAEAVLMAGSGFDALDDAALNAALGCVFEPALVGCNLVDAEVALPFKFGSGVAKEAVGRYVGRRTHDGSDTLSRRRALAAPTESDRR